MSRFSSATKLADHLATQPGWEARGNLLLGQIKDEQDDQEGAAEHRAGHWISIRRGQALRTDNPVPKAAGPGTARTGDLDEASANCRTVLTAGPDPEASWLLSRSYLQARSMRRGGNRDRSESRIPGKASPDPEPALYVGSARCAPCHGCYSPIGADWPACLDVPGGVPSSKTCRFPITRSRTRLKGTSATHRRNLAGQIQIETRDHGKVYRALVDYAFGSGDRGLTLVGHEHSGRAREIRLSYYGDGSTWDVTSGHLTQLPSGENFWDGPSVLMTSTAVCFATPRSRVQPR